jgi:hypothetical protein
MENKSMERFLRNIKNHKMEILKDDNLYRHIRFERPASGTYCFDIVTYPNVLIISGDMGTWVFSRTEDMFKFFRQDKLEINPAYWAEKALSYDARNSPLEFCDQVFEETVSEYFQEYFEEECEEDEGLFERFSDWLSINEYSDIEFYRVTRVCEFIDENNLSHDFMESVYSAGKKINIHFEWCLYAIVWGISEYDKHISDLMKCKKCGCQKVIKDLEAEPIGFGSHDEPLFLSYECPVYEKCRDENNG